jgi:hypothetical protein
MSKKWPLAVATFAAAVVAGMGANAASAGEVTGNCNNAPNGQSQANCREDYSQGASICSFSGQNDGEPPPGRTQSYGQDVRAGRADPTDKETPFRPGFACNPNNPFPPAA